MATKVKVSNNSVFIFDFQRLTNPVVDPEVRENVVENHVPRSKVLSSNSQDSNHSTNTDIREKNEWKLLLLEVEGVLAKVEVGDLWESLLRLLTSQVREEVSWPAEKLVLDAVPEGDQWSILGKVSKLNGSSVGLLSAVRFNPRLALVWDESGILLDVSGRLVVSGVRDLPGVEWHQEERVHDQSHDVVELAGLGESTVTALMGENPDTGENESLKDGVASPSDAASVHVWNVGDVGGGVGEDGNVEIVADNISHGADVGWLEAVCWDSIVDLLHGVARQLELIAKLVNVLLLLVLLTGSSIACCSLLKGSHRCVGWCHYRWWREE